MEMVSKFACFSAGAFASLILCAEITKEEVNIDKLAMQADALQARISSLESSLPKPKFESPNPYKADALQARISSLESSLPKPKFESPNPDKVEG